MGEVIRAMPKRKHLFFQEGFPNDDDVDDGVNGGAGEPTHSSGIEADEGGEKENGVDADLHDRHVLLH